MFIYIKKIYEQKYNNNCNTEIKYQIKFSDKEPEIIIEHLSKPNELSWFGNGSYFQTLVVLKYLINNKYAVASNIVRYYQFLSSTRAITGTYSYRDKTNKIIKGYDWECDRYYINELKPDLNYNKYFPCIHRKCLKEFIKNV